MSTDQLLHNALSDMADAADELPGGGDHIRKLADRIIGPQNAEVLAAAWDKTFEGTIVPKSDWPTDPEVLKPHGLQDFPNYFLKFLDALVDARDDISEKPVHPHVHDFKRVPDSERNDTLRFCATMFRCECGESYTC